MKPANFTARLTKLRRQLNQQNLDAVLINHLPHVRYLCGYSGSNGFLFITDKKAFFFTDFRYTEQAGKEVRRAKVIVDERDIWKNLANNDDAKQPRIKIGFQTDYLTQQIHLRLRHLLPQALLVGISGLVEQLTMVKDADELAAIKKAVAISDLGFAKILEFIRPGVREIEVAAELEYLMRRAGSEKTAFDTIVASGARAALPHGVASRKKIAHGDLVTLDFGATCQGYVSDITRTVVVGKPTSRQKRIYQLVGRAQRAALRRMRAGVTGIAADRAARQVFIRAKVAKRFGHGLGHGFGLYVHEGPALSTQSKDTLARGMVVTVEPGLYFPGWGGVRIEDDVVVTTSGVKVLTQSDRRLISV